VNSGFTWRLRRRRRSVHDDDIRSPDRPRSRSRRRRCLPFGGSPKASTLAAIARARPTCIVFFGDSPGHLEAARATYAAFVGVVKEHDGFASADVVRLFDVTSPPRVERCMREALDWLAR